MNERETPVAVVAEDVAPQAKKTNYPAEFAERVSGRVKRRLGDLFGLTNFGVNLTTIAPGSMSALRHAHAKQDELVYVLWGELTLVTDEGETLLTAGMCAGFPGGTGNAHHLMNRSDADAGYLEIGDRLEGDAVTYPDDDIAAVMENGAWRMTRKDGTPFT